CPTAQPVETASGLRARRRILADESDAAWYLVATGLQGGYTVGTLPFTFRNGVTNERGHARPLGHRARRAARRGETLTLGVRGTPDPRRPQARPGEAGANATSDRAGP